MKIFNHESILNGAPEKKSKEKVLKKKKFVLKKKVK